MMQRLFPPAAGGQLPAVDLDEAYAVAPGRRCVRANMVTSVDGVAVVPDVSATLSGPADRRVFAVLRGLADVVLVGAGTARRENYGGVRPSPARQARRRDAGLAPVPPLAVVSARLDLEPAARLFTDTAARPLIVTCAAAPADRRAALAERAEVVLAGEDSVDLPRALHALAGRGLRHVLCEGGPALLGTLVAAGAVDELCWTVAPLLAGAGGRLTDSPALRPPAAATLRHVLAADGFLFLRYAVRRASADPGARSGAGA